MKNNKAIFFLPVLSGILLSLGYSFSGFNFLLWIAFIPLLFFIRFCVKDSTEADARKKPIFSGGYLAGLVFFGITTSWFLFASMADWVGSERKIIIILILALTWLVYILFASIFTGAAAYLFFRLRIRSWLDIFLFPALWVIFEYFRAWGVAVFILGPVSLFGPHITLGNLGYALAGTPFIVLAGTVGVYGLGFLMVFFNCLIFSTVISAKRPILQRKNFAKFGLCFSVIFLAFVSVYYFQNLRSGKNFSSKNPIPVSVIQTNFPSLFSYTPAQEAEFSDIQLNLFAQAARQNEWPRIIVFPEHANFLKRAALFSSRASLADVLKQKDALIVDSGWHSNERTGSAVTRLIYFDVRTAKVIAGFDKVLLMPVGDYLPYFLTSVLNLIGRDDWIVNMEMTRGYEKGGELTMVEYNGIKLGGLLCSEIVSPYLYRELTAKGAEVLIGAASDAVFKGDRLLLGQLLAMAKMRAAENNRYFIQAANQGDSYVIDNRGRLVVKNEKIGNEVIHADAQLITGRTFYNRF
ncbi:MAG: apolipoprotein N-acyltransferase, partial [bacterium]|nr:apolipoprotein N-acyltransferase [bacterium]